MKRVIFLLLLIPLFFACGGGETSSSSSEPKACAECGNGMCEDGETEASCPADCKLKTLKNNGEGCSDDTECKSDYCSSLSKTCKAKVCNDGETKSEADHAIYRCIDGEWEMRGCVFGYNFSEQGTCVAD